MAGNLANLQTATERKRRDATQRAEAALTDLALRGEAITFRAVARAAGCSPDFLYRTPALAERIRQLRGHQQTAPPQRDEAAASPSATVRALATQITELKRRHRDELAELRAALAAAHGENLELRRRLGHQMTATPSAGTLGSDG